MDNFLARAWAKREAVQSSSATVASEGTPKATGGSFTANVVQVTDVTGSLGVAAWYRGVELRANTMSQLILEYQKKNDTTHGGNYATDMRGGGKKLNYLLQIQPNPTMTWAQLMKQAEQMRISQGNAVIYVERKANGEVEHFWLCYRATLNTVTMEYDISYYCQGGVVNKHVEAWEVLHIKNTFSKDYGLTGVGTLFYARHALTLAATNDKLVTETAAKGMRQKLLVQEEKQGKVGLGRASQKQMEKVTDKLDHDLADKDVILLSNVASVTPISTNLQQQEINQLRQFSVSEVARYLGVPKIMLMSSENESYKTPEAATQEFLLRTIQPLAHDWEVELNAKLLGPEGYPEHRFKMDDDSLMRLDPQGRANIGKVLIETGVKCVNELRADYDLPAVEGGDTHYISTNLQVVGSNTETEEGGAE